MSAVWVSRCVLDAHRLRSEIDKLLGSDRILCLVVAIETALADERYEVRIRSSPHMLRARVRSEQV